MESHSREENLPRASRKVGFQVLGTKVTFDSSDDVELHNRFDRAWRAFYKFTALLCCQTALLGERFRLLDTLVASTLFWCSGSWNLTLKQMSKLLGIQQKMLQKMIPAKKRHPKLSRTS